MKKRWLAGGSVAALVLLGLVTVFSLFTPSAIKCDFHYRMAELDCIKQSIDPFRVWNEEVVLRPYYSNNPAIKSVPSGCTEMISVYVPWEYTLVLPLSLIDEGVAWWIYTVLSFLALAGVVGLAFKVCRQRMALPEATLCASIPVLVVAHAVWSNFQVGNYASIVLFAAVLMAICLNAKRDVAAGFCWALMMVKPQIGLIFAIPLILRFRVVSGFVAVSTCLLLSLYPVIQCHASLVDLLREPSIASAFAFEGCGTWPKFLCGIFSTNGDIMAGTVVGAFVCLVMTWFVRNEKDWFVFLMPAAIMSCCWTYTQAYSHAMGWFVAFVLVRELIFHPHARFLWVLAALSAFSLTRWFLAFHGLVIFAGGRFPLSDYAFRCVDSLNSTLSLAVAVALCVWFYPPFFRRFSGRSFAPLR